MTSLIVILLLALFAWFWFENQGCKEIAILICKQTCRQIKVQLLDDTIVLTRIRLKRKSSGQLTLQRTYCFEFTDDGNARRSSTLLLTGKRLELIEIQGYFIETVDNSI